jgi:hypothetical protein
MSDKDLKALLADPDFELAMFRGTLFAPVNSIFSPKRGALSDGSKMVIIAWYFRRLDLSMLARKTVERRAESVEKSWTPNSTQTWEEIARGLGQYDSDANDSDMEQDIEAEEQPWEREWAKIWTSSSIRLGLFMIDSSYDGNASEWSCDGDVLEQPST